MPKFFPIPQFVSSGKHFFRSKYAPYSIYARNLYSSSTSRHDTRRTAPVSSSSTASSVALADDHHIIEISNKAILSKQLSAIKVILDSLSTFPHNEVKRKGYLQTLYPTNEWVQTYSSLASQQHVDTLMHILSDLQKQLISQGDSLPDVEQSTGTGSDAQRVRWLDIKKLLSEQDTPLDLANLSPTMYAHLQSIYLPIMFRYLQPSIPLNEKTFQTLFQHTLTLYKCFLQTSFTLWHSYTAVDSTLSLAGSKPTKQTRDLLLPLLATVCQSFEDGELVFHPVLRSEEFAGYEIACDYLLRHAEQSGNNNSEQNARVVVFEAQAPQLTDTKILQCILACELLASQKPLNHHKESVPVGNNIISNDNNVYGVVTSFDCWHFVKVSADSLSLETVTLTLNNSLPTEQSLRTLTGKLVAMLKDES